MRAVSILALLVLAFAVRGFADGFTVRYDHSVSVKDLAEEKEEKASLPSPIAMRLPAFPPEILRVGVGGEASIRFRVHEDGSVSDVTVVSARHEEFGEAARTAVIDWKFTPPINRLSRKPAALWAKCRFVFKVDAE